uniref:sirohydrochlorin chelatase n=1 Tax=Nocardia acidivorans TaxID=404580 RepID=UPI000A3DB9ED
MSAPALILVAHGTRSRRGVEMIAALAEAVAAEVVAQARGWETGATDFMSWVHAETGAGAAFGAASAPLTEGVVPRVRTAFVDVLGPSPAEVLRDMEDVPAVVVPAFLASGYHVYQDVPREVAASGREAVAVTRAMGPDPAVAAVMRMRL